jgi:hypothetical protein
VLGDGATARDDWFDRLQQLTIGSDVIFLDPDNGLEVRSCRRGARRSSKYAYWSEVAALVRSGFSVIVYQHLPRMTRQQLTQQRLAEAIEWLDLPRCLVLSTSGVDYFAFPQERHCAAVERAFAAVAAASSGALRHSSYEIGSNADLPQELAGKASPVEALADRELLSAARRRVRPGMTTTPGYVNRNQQTVIGLSDAAPTLHGQKVYVLACGSCGHQYGANGCDVFQRKCPECQGGAGHGEV